MFGLDVLRRIDWDEISRAPTAAFLEATGKTSCADDVEVLRKNAARGVVPARFVAGVQGGAGSPTSMPGLDQLKPGVVYFASIVRGAAGNAFGDLVARNIDVSGDLFAFVGSLADVVTDEAKIKTGNLSFEDVLVLEDRLEGMKIILVLGSMLFSVVVDAISLGVLGSITGLVIHLIDDVVGEASRITSTQLWRRAVAEPLQVGLQKLHRNGELSASQAEEAYALGILDDAELVDVLAASGLNDRAIVTRAALARVRYANQIGIFPVRVKPAPRTVLDTALRAGVLSDQEYVQALADQGYDDRAISIFWALFQLKNPPAPATAVVVE